MHSKDSLTTDVVVKSIKYNLLLDPFVVMPPKSTALFLVMEVKVKSSIGGGLSPITDGDNHSSKSNYKIIIYRIYYCIAFEGLNFHDCVEICKLKICENLYNNYG